LKQFSIVFPLSKRRISCVPVPTSIARIRIEADIPWLLLVPREDASYQEYSIHHHC
jgi:hypothetical protein